MQHQYLNIASRMVWQNNVKLASKLVCKSLVVNDLVKVSNSQVCLKYPNMFSLKFQNARYEALQKSMVVQKAISKSDNPEKVKHKAKTSFENIGKGC